MSILYLSNYGDINSGWAVAAQECIRALSKYTTVVPRRFKFAPQNPPQDILKMESQEADCKVCIQQCLPPMMVYDSNYYNIGACFTEVDSLVLSGWAQYLNLMDEVWTFSEHSKKALEKEVTVPIRVFPLPIDCQKLFQAQLFNLKEQCQNDFLFYTICDFNKRKNLSGLVKAFHLEFAHYEPVNLVIKTNAPEQEVHDFCHKLKEGLKLYNPNLFKKEVIIGGYLQQEQIYALHKSADVFCLPSHGEGWSIPAQEALCLGKTPIVTFGEFINNDNGWVVKSTRTNCFASTSLEGLETGYDTWAEPDMDDLRRCMREAYERADLRQEKSIRGIKDGLQFSYEKVGKLMWDEIKNKL